ncbi:MAG: restriction endonuclease subunit S [Pseudomonadota bacterium]
MKTMEGWIYKPLGEIASLVKGISYSSSDYCGPDEGAIFLTIKCVSKAGGFKKEGIKYYRGPIREQEILEIGDLLIANTDLTRDGDIVGCPVHVPDLGTELVTMSMDLSKLMIDPEKVDGKFLYFKLMTEPVRRYMQDHASGSTVLHLQTKAVPKLNLLVPADKEEQTQIAAILSTLDKAIEQTEAIIAKQQQIKTGLMQDLLVKGIDEHGRIRSEDTHEFKDSTLGRIPVEWEVTNLGNIISKHGGKIQTGPFGSQLHAYEYVNEGIPVVMPQDISSPGISTIKIARITEGRAKQLLRHNMLPGDLIFARRGDLSRCAWITEQQKGWICGTGCLLMRPPSKILSPKWTAEIYRFHTTQLQVDVQAVGSTMPNLNTGILSALLIALPTYEEQVRIEEHLQAAEEYQNKMADQFTKLSLQKAGLMHDLFTGTVRVN